MYKFIGIGFVERNDAFNFKYELQHFSQQVANMKTRVAAGGIEETRFDSQLVSALMLMMSMVLLGPELGCIFRRA